MFSKSSYHLLRLAKSPSLKQIVEVHNYPEVQKRERSNISHRSPENTRSMPFFPRQGKNPASCMPLYVEKALRLDDPYYKKSDINTRAYNQTWTEYPDVMLRRKALQAEESKESQ